MMRVEAVVALVPGIRAPELDDWIARGWLLPQGEPPEWMFAEIDVARVRLIHDLLHVLAVEQDTVSLVLGLLDQVYALRRDLRDVMAAVGDQPEPVRQALLATLIAHRR